MTWASLRNRGRSRAGNAECYEGALSSGQPVLDHVDYLLRWTQAEPIIDALELAPLLP